MTDVIAHIDKEIAMLQQAKALLSGAPDVLPKASRGRPRGSKNVVAEVATSAKKKSKRQLSPEGRKAIADAMKRRWAERRKTATK